MNIIMNFHQLEPTDAIKDVVTKKSEKLKKFFEGAFEVKWTMSADKNGHHSHAIITGNGFNINADSVKDDLYKTFDEVISKLEKQLSKKKSISKNKIHRKSAPVESAPDQSDFEEEMEETEG